MEQELDRPRRIMLREGEFRKLVKGGIVRRHGVEIGLSDIGWLTMLEAINEAQNADKDVDKNPVK